MTALVIRRVHLGVVLLWRRWRPPAAEIVARREQLAQQARLSAEQRLAAEAYHWTVANNAPPVPAAPDPDR